MRPLDIKCPTCQAVPDEECVEAIRGRLRQVGVHAERKAAAAASAEACGARRGYESPTMTCSLPAGHDGAHRWAGLVR